MAVVAMKQLLESGVHFGHVTRRWDPKMAPYIFTARNGIHIIDLKKTAECIEVAYKELFKVVEAGGKVLFVGTKKQAQEAVKEEALRTGHYYVDVRWLGGTLTNFKTIRKSIKKLHDLYQMEKDGVFDKLPKKEVLDLKKHRAKLEKLIGGIKEMRKVPEAIFVVDPKEEINAVLEARKLGIKVFGIVDTNCNPEDVDYIIPANDDAIRAVKLVTWVMGNAIIEAQGGVVEKFDNEEAADMSDTSRKNDDRPKKPYQGKPYQQRDENKKSEPRFTKTDEVKQTEPKPKVEEVKVDVKPTTEAPKAKEVKPTITPETAKVAKEVVMTEVDEAETDEELNRLESCGLHSYHISKVKDGEGDHKWRVRRSCTDKTIKFFHTQLEAIDYAKKLAKKDEISITIHKVDGKIRKQDYAVKEEKTVAPKKKTTKKETAEKTE